MELSIEDFTGYTNSLVEENIKVLIICNEDKISDENYKFYKEKIIEITFEYNPETSAIIESIIKSRYAGSNAYISFLHLVKYLLNEIAEKNSHNYRHLIYSIDSLHDIYSILKVKVLDSRQGWVEKCNQELNNIALFTLSISTEFKASRLSYADRTSFIKNAQSNKTLAELYDSDDGHQTTPTDDNKFNLFIKKYYGDVKSYKHYDSIFNLVTGAKEFDVNLFETEFKKLHHLQKGSVLPEYQLLKDLAYYNCLLLNEDEYKSKTLQLIAYANEAKYKLTEYLTVFHYVIRFDNILDIQLDDLVTNLKSVMSRIAENHQALKEQILSQFDFEHNITKDEYMENIRKHGLSILIEYRNKNEKAENDNLIYYITKGLDKLYDKYHAKDDFRLRLNTTPILESVDPDMLADSLLASTPFSIQFFGSFLSDRYSNISYRLEGKTLYFLNERIQKHLTNNPEKSLSNWALKSLQSL